MKSLYREVAKRPPHSNYVTPPPPNNILFGIWSRTPGRLRTLDTIRVDTIREIGAKSWPSPKPLTLFGKSERSLGPSRFSGLTRFGESERSLGPSRNPWHYLGWHYSGNRSEVLVAPKTLDTIWYDTISPAHYLGGGGGYYESHSERYNLQCSGTGCAGSATSYGRRGSRGSCVSARPAQKERPVRCVWGRHPCLL